MHPLHVEVRPARRLVVGLIAAVKAKNVEGWERALLSYRKQVVPVGLQTLFCYARIANRNWPADWVDFTRLL